MASRFWLSFGALALVLQLSGCSDPPLEQGESFQTRGRAGASAPPPPTAVFDPGGTHPANPVAEGGPPVARPTGTPVRTAGPSGKTTPNTSGRPPIEFDVVGEETIIDPDSHRGRAKKLRDRPKTPEGTTPAEPEKPEKKS